MPYELSARFIVGNTVERSQPRAIIHSVPAPSTHVEVASILLRDEDPDLLENAVPSPAWKPQSWNVIRDLKDVGPERYKKAVA